MKWFRQCDRRYPFLWEDPHQPAARWHGDNEGPAQYLASTPEGAWAEFLRHEEITDPSELAGISRALWVIDDGGESDRATATTLPTETTTGDESTYPACQQEARDLRERGTTALLAPSAALVEGLSAGYRVELGFRVEDVSTQVLVLFGRRPHLIGFAVVTDGRPAEETLRRVNHIGQEPV